MRRIPRLDLPFIFLAAVLGVGCGRPVPPPKPPVLPVQIADNAAIEEKAEPAEEVADESTDDGVQHEPSSSDAQENVTSQNEVPAIDPSDASETASAEPAESQPSTLAPPERIMLLTPSGPLLVDLHITIEGEPYRENFEAVLEDILKIADADQDGSVTWNEIMSHPRFRDGQFGNPPTTTYQAQQDMTRLYDSTANGRVDPDELVRYLTSNQGTAQPITLTTSNSQRVFNRDESPLRTWLDANEDLVLDKDEIDNAAGRLRLRDANDDEVLLPADFLEPASMQPGMTARRRPKIIGPPKAGWHIREEEQWNEMLAGWETLYSLGSPISADDLILGSDLFGKLNIDNDQVISAYEMGMLVDVEAHIAVEIELGKGDAETPTEIKLAALRLPLDQTEGVTQHQPNRITIQLPDTALDIFATDAIGYARYDEQAKDLLRRGDADSNNYLSKDEFGAIGGAVMVEFSAADLDGNAMVFADEIETLLKQRNIASRSQLRVKADDQDDALWQSVDTNYDGRIDSRELAEVADALASLDANEDGDVQLHELRGSMMIGVVRGGANGPVRPNDTSFQVPTVVRKPSESAPRWFTGMDRNRDAGISWREFLGSREQFEQLDADADGFIDLEEATKE